MLEMTGYRTAAHVEAHPTTFRARFVRRDMIALAFVLFLLVAGAGGLLLCSPRVDIQCLQVSETCSVEAVYAGLLHTTDVLDIRGAGGPARVVGVGKRDRFLALPLEAGGERRLGQFGTVTPLVTDAVNLAVRGQRDVSASNPGVYQLLCVFFGIVIGLVFLAVFGRERIDITLSAHGSRIHLTLRRRARPTRTLDFAGEELRRFAGQLTTRTSNRWPNTVQVFYSLQAELPHESEEILPAMPDRPELHDLTARLNHHLHGTLGHAR